MPAKARPPLKLYSVCMNTLYYFLLKCMKPRVKIAKLNIKQGASSAFVSGCKTCKVSVSASSEGVYTLLICNWNILVFVSHPRHSNKNDLLTTAFKNMAPVFKTLTLEYTLFYEAVAQYCCCCCSKWRWKSARLRLEDFDGTELHG